ncbi:hypothetical protein KI387_001165 [Taxus chinensis]|uniref:Uncharacterized protein n=1 Tax=Taxus chinensis TaxID=29808 RepID=A0AA38GWV4_TAXCH|nr:hypothetical protein KI387_001165 [Taxus chinensis]
MINTFLKSLNASQLQEIVGVLQRQGQDKIPCVRKVIAETIDRARLLSESASSQKTSFAANDRVFTDQSVEHTYYSSENSVILGNQAIEEYEDSGLDQFSGITEWSVTHNPIARQEIQDDVRQAFASSF